MVALLRDIITDAPRAIQRTALSGDGGKIGRMTLGPKAGAAIKLSADIEVADRLTIGEGLETTLAGMMLGYAPAWALGDAGELAAFPVLIGVESITFLVDHDLSGTGQQAALRCSARWTSAGREVFAPARGRRERFAEMRRRRRMTVTSPATFAPPPDVDKTFVAGLDLLARSPPLWPVDANRWARMIAAVFAFCGEVGSGPREAVV
jgi:Toprim domain